MRTSLFTRWQAKCHYSAILLLYCVYPCSAWLWQFMGADIPVSLDGVDFLEGAEEYDSFLEDFVDTSHLDSQMLLVADPAAIDADGTVPAPEVFCALAALLLFQARSNGCILRPSSWCWLSAAYAASSLSAVNPEFLVFSEYQQNALRELWDMALPGGSAAVIVFLGCHVVAHILVGLQGGEASCEGGTLLERTVLHLRQASRLATRLTHVIFGVSVVMALCSMQYRKYLHFSLAFLFANVSIILFVWLCFFPARESHQMFKCSGRVELEEEENEMQAPTHFSSRPASLEAETVFPAPPIPSTSSRVRALVAAHEKNCEHAQQVASGQLSFVLPQDVDGQSLFDMSPPGNAPSQTTRPKRSASCKGVRFADQPLTPERKREVQDSEQFARKAMAVEPGGPQSIDSAASIPLSSRHVVDFQRVTRGSSNPPGADRSNACKSPYSLSKQDVVQHDALDASVRSHGYCGSGKNTRTEPSLELLVSEKRPQRSVPMETMRRRRASITSADQPASEVVRQSGEQWIQRKVAVLESISGSLNSSSRATSSSCSASNAINSAAPLEKGSPPVVLSESAQRRASFREASATRRLSLQSMSKPSLQNGSSPQSSGVSGQTGDNVNAGSPASSTGSSVRVLDLPRETEDSVLAVGLEACCHVEAVASAVSAKVSSPNKRKASVQRRDLPTPRHVRPTYSARAQKENSNPKVLFLGPQEKSALLQASASPEAKKRIAGANVFAAKGPLSKGGHGGQLDVFVDSQFSTAKSNCAESDVKAPLSAIMSLVLEDDLAGMKASLQRSLAAKKAIRAPWVAGDIVGVAKALLALRPDPPTIEGVLDRLAARSSDHPFTVCEAATLLQLAVKVTGPRAESVFLQAIACCLSAVGPLKARSDTGDLQSTQQKHRYADGKDEDPRLPLEKMASTLDRVDLQFEETVVAIQARLRGYVEDVLRSLRD